MSADYSHVKSIDALSAACKQRDAARERIAAVERALERLISEAEKLEDIYNAENFDGNLDMTEAAAEIRWYCIRTIRAAISGN